MKGYLSTTCAMFESFFRCMDSLVIYGFSDEAFFEQEFETQEDFFEAAKQLAKSILEDTRTSTLEVKYYVGGSVAGSAQGIARATADVDLVADLSREHVAGVGKKPEFYRPRHAPVTTGEG